MKMVVGFGINEEVIMTRYYLEVLKEDISICVDSDINYHHEFEVGDIIDINMYIDKGPKVVFGEFEYDAQFILGWDKSQSRMRVGRLTVDWCINNGYLCDITIQVERDRK